MDIDAFIRSITRMELPVSEVHGVLAGFLCAGGLWEDASDEDLQVLLPDADGQLIRGLLDEVHSQLDSVNMDFAPLVPDDESPMAERLEALSDWCGGFLAGYGLGVGDARVDDATREMLGDLVAIADIDAEEDDTEENEVDFSELFEYARVVAMNLYDGGGAGTGLGEDDDA